MGEMVEGAQVSPTTSIDEDLSAPRRSEVRRTLAVFVRNRAAVVGAIILVLFVLIALFADFVAPYDPIKMVPKDHRQSPSSEHWMGTDLLGRDILTRVIYGARLSLLIGLISVAIGATVGTVLGLGAGYYGGMSDSLVMRVMDGMLAFPGILLALMIIAALGTGISNVMIAVGVATIPIYARLVRGTVLSAKEDLYVESARVIGSSNRRIMFQHILPNVIAPVIVLSTLQFGIAILTAAGLSFLGLGAQPPTPEWGLMVSMGREYLGKAWWMSTFPGLAITVTVIAINLLGDGLREALDPRQRKI
jgi:peptide/nickel transport system permease protein